jgi:hypothetical protein
MKLIALSFALDFGRVMAARTTRTAPETTITTATDLAIMIATVALGYVSFLLSPTRRSPYWSLTLDLQGGGRSGGYGGSGGDGGGYGSRNRDNDNNDSYGSNNDNY